jgi:hypothetical protein
MLLVKFCHGIMTDIPHQTESNNSAVKREEIQTITVPRSKGLCSGNILIGADIAPLLITENVRVRDYVGL